MSVWVYIENVSGEVLPAPRRHTDGGTAQLGGSVECELNVTYNYSPLFRLAAGHVGLLEEYRQHGLEDEFPGSHDQVLVARCLYIARSGLWAFLGLNEEGEKGLTPCHVAEPVLTALAGALWPADRLGSDGLPDMLNRDGYWTPTPLNAARPLYLLAEWCRVHPAGRIRCSG